MQWTASVHTLYMSKPMDCFVRYNTCPNKAPRNGLLRYILHMSKPVTTSVLKVLRNDGFGITLRMSKPVITSAFKKCYAMDWVHTLHMSKPVTNFVFKVLRNGLLWHIPYAISKPAITSVFKVPRNGLRWHNFAHVQTCDNRCILCPHIQTCHSVRVQKVLRNGLLGYTLCTCPKLQ